MSRKEAKYIHQKLFAAAAVIVSAATHISPALAKTPLSCGQNAQTLELSCIDPKRVTHNGDLKAAKLWTGGPKEIRETAYTIVANCKHGTVELRDRKGIVFARSRPDSDQSRVLYRTICNTPSKLDKLL